MRPSSACTIPPVLFRKIVPRYASGDGWLVPPSFIGQTHASCRSRALSRVIWSSGLKLDAAWSQIDFEFAPANAERYANLALGMQGTGGSSSISNSWLQYRQAAAAARAISMVANSERRSSALVVSGARRTAAVARPRSVIP